MKIKIDPETIFSRLIYLILALLLLNIAGIISRHYLSFDATYGLIPLFDFDTENSVPTFYSALALFSACLLLIAISIAHKRNGSPYLSWLGLAIIFLFLTIDEITSIHEQFNAPVRNILHTSGLLFLAWVIPYGAAVAVFVIAYWKFLTELPKNTRILFVVSGAIYVAGAIGFELFGGRQLELHGKDNLVFAVLYTCEEFLEMLGIVIFIYALLTYIVSQFESLEISLKKPESP